MIRGVILDLDGTVYRGEREIPGAADFIAWLLDRGIRPLYVTNRSSRVPEEVRAQISGFGVPCSCDDVLTSSGAAARYLATGSAYCIGEHGLSAALEEAGISLTEKDPDYVVVGYDSHLTYAKLTTACRCIDGGARFLATNPDRVLYVEDGMLPGTGAIVAAVTTACGAEPEVIGKPEPLIFEMALAQMGLPPRDVIAVGDNIETDIRAADSAGIRSVLLLTGISTREDADRSPVKPTWIADDFTALTRLVEEINSGAEA